MNPAKRFVDPAATISNAAWILLAVAVILAVCLKIDFGGPVIDLFHEGEYFATQLSVDHAELLGYPHLIHGLLDTWPNLLARNLCGLDSSLACTRAVNATLVGLAMLLYLCCVVVLVWGRRNLTAPAAILVGILFLVVNGSKVDHIGLHQGAPAIRDIALLAELAALLAALRAKRSGYRHASLLIAGIAAGFGLFWCYNRGIIGLGLLGTYGIISLCLRRRISEIAAALLGLALAVASMALIDPLGMQAHLANIVHWVGSALAQWQAKVAGNAPPTVAFSPSAGVISLMIVGLMAYVGWHIRPGVSLADPNQRPTGVLLVAMATGALPIVLKRPDAVHAAFALPFLFLLVIFAIDLRRPRWLAPAGSEYLLFGGVFTALLTTFVSAPGGWGARGAVRANLGYLYSGMPRNQALFSSDQR